MARTSATPRTRALSRILAAVGALALVTAISLVAATLSSQGARPAGAGDLGAGRAHKRVGAAGYWVRDHSMVGPVSEWRLIHHRVCDYGLYRRSRPVVSHRPGGPARADLSRIEVSEDLHIYGCGNKRRWHRATVGAVGSHPYRVACSARFADRRTGQHDRDRQLENTSARWWFADQWIRDNSVPRRCRAKSSDVLLVRATNHTDPDPSHKW